MALRERIALSNRSWALGVSTLLCVLAALPVTSQDRVGGSSRQVSGTAATSTPPVPSADGQAPTSSTTSSPSIGFLRSFPDDDSRIQSKSLLERLRGVLFAQREESLLIRPLGLTATGDVLYVTDPGAGALVIIDLIKNSVRKVTSAGDDSLVSPIGISAGQQHVYFSDSYLKCIFKYDPRSRSLKRFTSQHMLRPTGVALAEAEGLLFVVDTGAHQVLVYGLDGKLQRTFGKRGGQNGEFNFPTHAWLARDGTLWVVDSLNYRVQQFRHDGTFLAQFGRHGDGAGDFANPKGISSDSRGHLYVVDTLFDAVQVFDTGGQLLTRFGERGRQPGQMWLPNGMFIDSSDRIFVADSYNRRVQIFQYRKGADASP